MPSFPVHHQLPEFTQTHAHRVGDAINHLIPFSSRLQSFPASGFFQMSQLFASGGQNTGVFFNLSPSNEYSELISFWTDWLELLAVQETLKSLLQHHSSKASILLHSAFFTVQLSCPYMTPTHSIELGMCSLVECTFRSPVFAKLIQSCLTLCDPMDYSLPGSSIHGISQARILEWATIHFSRDLRDPGMEPRSLTSPALAVGFFTTSTTREAPKLLSW